MKEIIASRMKPLRISTAASKIVGKCKLMASDNLSIMHDKHISLNKVESEFSDINQGASGELIQLLDSNICQNQRLLIKNDTKNYLAINEIKQNRSGTYLYTLPMYLNFEIHNTSGFIQGTSEFEEGELLEYMGYIKRLTAKPGNHYLNIGGLRFATNNRGPYSENKKYSDKLTEKGLKRLEDLAKFLVH